MLAPDTAANVLVGALAILSLVLLLLSTRAWLYARDPRTFLLTFAFLLLFVKALVLLVGLFRLTNWTSLLPVSLAFDLALALAFYAAVFR